MKIAIIGAGVAGMSAAWDLTRAGHEVDLFEAGDRVGGLAAGFKDEAWDWELEKFYHHWFEGDKYILSLIAEIGESENVIFQRPKTSFWIEGDIVRSEIEPISVLRLPMSWSGKMKFIAGGAFVKLNPFWKMFEPYTADAWMRHYMGEEGYERYFKTLLVGKFGKYYNEVNMAWMWSRVQARSLKLGTFRGGFQQFLERLAEAITQQGARIHLNTPAQAIELASIDEPVLVAGGVRRTYDRIISTTSPRIMLKLAPLLENTHYGDQMKALKSIGGLCVVFALKQQLLTDGTYWLNLPAESPDYHDNEFPFLALVEHTNWMDKAHYGGDHIVYCGDYVVPTHEYFQWSEADLMAHFLPALKQVNPNFQRDWVRKWWVFRAPYAQPIPGVNHSSTIPKLDTPIPNVIWASMSQIYPWDRGTNFSVELGRRAARIALGQEKDTRAVKGG